MGGLNKYSSFFHICTYEEPKEKHFHHYKKSLSFSICLHINSKNEYVSNYSRFVLTTHNPAAGYTVINRNDNMIVQPHDTLATVQPTSTQDTSLMDMMKPLSQKPFSTF